MDGIYDLYSISYTCSSAVPKGVLRDASNVSQHLAGIDQYAINSRI